MSGSGAQLTVDDLRRCIEGRIPPILATADGSGEPNIVFLSAVYVVDVERLALSNQFMGKSTANLVSNPRASLILTDPRTGNEYRLQIEYERTERRGPTFERLKTEVDEIAVFTGQVGVFRLRSADIYRVVAIELFNGHIDAEDIAPRRSAAEQLGHLGELTQRLSRCADLDTLVTTVVGSLDELLGYERSMVMLLDEPGTRLFTIASHGYVAEGVGSELAIGEGAAGQAAAHNRAVRLGGIQYTDKYARSVRRGFEDTKPEIEVPTRPDTRSRLAVPAVSRGEVRGVLVVESPHPTAFDATDETLLGIVGSLIAERAELDRPFDDEPPPPVPDRVDRNYLAAKPASSAVTHVRFFASDGSVFLDGDYLIRGVAGRILWSMARRNVQTGQTEFTNKEIRLDKSLDLPGFRDNLDTRLILLKRRLEERSAPIQLEKTGRARFALLRAATLQLEAHE